MDGHELSRYEESNLKIDKDRVLTYSNIACPLDCKYCFANEIIRGHENESGIYLSEKQFNLLEQLPPDITTVMLGCDTEFLQDKAQALEVLGRLSDIGKDITIITKLPLGNNFIAELADIDQRVKSNGNSLSFSISIACTKSRDKWEPTTPSIDSRIETLRKVYEAGISTMVAIRPLIPNITTGELDEIIDKTKDYTLGYYSGPMYLKGLNNGMITADELTALGCIVSEEIEEIPWMLEGNKFLKIETPALMSYLKHKIEQSGKLLFDGAADGVKYIKESERVKP
jgi:DNA repair photolyase